MATTNGVRYISYIKAVLGDDNGDGTYTKVMDFGIQQDSTLNYGYPVSTSFKSASMGIATDDFARYNTGDNTAENPYIINNYARYEYLMTQATGPDPLGNQTLRRNVYLKLANDIYVGSTVKGINWTDDNSKINISNAKAFGFYDVKLSSNTVNNAIGFISGKDITIKNLGIVGSFEGVDGAEHAGLLIGKAEKLSADGCYAILDKQIEVNNNNTIFGIFAGYAEGNISNCFASGDIEVRRAKYVGGMIGRWYGIGSKLERSFASGTITIKDAAKISEDAYCQRYIGGLIGWRDNSTIFNNCYVNVTMLDRQVSLGSTDKITSFYDSATIISVSANSDGVFTTLSSSSESYCDYNSYISVSEKTGDIYVDHYVDGRHITIIQKTTHNTVAELKAINYKDSEGNGFVPSNYHLPIQTAFVDNNVVYGKLGLDDSKETGSKMSPIKVVANNDIDDENDYYYLAEDITRESRLGNVKMLLGDGHTITSPNSTQPLFETEILETSIVSGLTIKNSPLASICNGYIYDTHVTGDFSGFAYGFAETANINAVFDNCSSEANITITPIYDETSHEYYFSCFVLNSELKVTTSSGLAGWTTRDYEGTIFRNITSSPIVTIDAEYSDQIDGGGISYSGGGIFEDILEIGFTIDANGNSIRFGGVSYQNDSHLKERGDISANTWYTIYDRYDWFTESKIKFGQISFKNALNVYFGGAFCYGSVSLSSNNYANKHFPYYNPCFAESDGKISIDASRNVCVGGLFNSGSVSGYNGSIDIPSMNVELKNTSTSNKFYSASIGLISGQASNISNITIYGNLYVCGDVYDNTHVGGIISSVYVGGVAGTCTKEIGESYDYLGNIKAIFMRADISVTGNYGDVYVGGIAGCVVSGLVRGDVYGNISVDVDADGVYVGGLAGRNSGNLGYDDQYYYDDQIDIDCRGSVELKNSAEYAYNYLGGIAGYNSGVILRSYVDGDVKGSFTSAKHVAYVGGICGYSNGIIQRAINSGLVAAYSDATDGLYRPTLYDVRAFSASGGYTTREAHLSLVVGGICGLSRDLTFEYCEKSRGDVRGLLTQKSNEKIIYLENEKEDQPMHNDDDDVTLYRYGGSTKAVGTYDQTYTDIFERAEGETWAECRVGGLVGIHHDTSLISPGYNWGMVGPGDASVYFRSYDDTYPIDIPKIGTYLAAIKSPGTTGSSSSTNTVSNPYFDFGRRSECIVDNDDYVTGHSYSRNLYNFNYYKFDINYSRNGYRCSFESHRSETKFTKLNIFDVESMDYYVGFTQLSALYSAFHIEGYSSKFDFADIQQNVQAKSSSETNNGVKIFAGVSNYNMSYWLVPYALGTGFSANTHSLSFKFAQLWAGEYVGAVVVD